MISSNEIKKRDFKKSIRGYDVNEVDAFLDTVSSHYEKLVIENKTQSEKIKSLLSDIEVYKENELNLQKAIIKSQELGEEIIINAKKKAELIVKEAELNSRKLRQDVESDIINKKQDLDEIKNRNDKLLEDLRVFLNDKINELEEFIRHKNIYKMELTSLSEMQDRVEKEIESGSEEGEDKKSLKKVYISSQVSNEQGKSFKDTFEVK